MANMATHLLKIDRAEERKNGRRLPAVHEGGPKNPLGRSPALYLFEGQ